MHFIFWICIRVRPSGIVRWVGKNVRVLRTKGKIGKFPGLVTSLGGALSTAKR